MVRSPRSPVPESSALGPEQAELICARRESPYAVHPDCGATAGVMIGFKVMSQQNMMRTWNLAHCVALSLGEDQ